MVVGQLTVRRRGDGRPVAPSLPQAGSTFPVVPSTVTRVPFRNLAVASPQPTTAGIPNSRAMIEACAAALPTSVTTAAALEDSGVHAGAVNGATRTSPGRSSPNCPGPRMMRTGPFARPGEARLLFALRATSGDVDAPDQPSPGERIARLVAGQEEDVPMSRLRSRSRRVT